MWIVTFLVFLSSMWIDSLAGHDDVTDSQAPSKIRVLTSAGCRSSKGLTLGNYSAVYKKDACMGNLGNMAFHYATLNVLADLEKVVFVFDKALPVDAAIVPTANFIYGPIAGYAKTFANMKIPEASILLGAGTQPNLLMSQGCGNARPTSAVPLSTTWELCTPERYAISEQYSIDLRAARANFKHWTVRGDFTKRVLALQNVSTEVLGCPSLMISPDPNLGLMLHQKVTDLRLNRAPKFLITLPGNRLSVVWRKYFTDLMELFPGSCFILQDPMDFGVVRGTQYCARVFGDVEEWQQFAKGFDAVLGTRIHGAMVALSVGVPVFVIAPDFRIAELAQTMRLPYRTIYDVESLLASKSLYDLLLESSDHWLRFDQRRQEFARKYVHLLRDVGIPPSKSLLGIARLVARSK